jgi:hypothetical protein
VKFGMQNINIPTHCLSTIVCMSTSTDMAMVQNIETVSNKFHVERLYIISKLFAKIK